MVAAEILPYMREARPSRKYAHTRLYNYFILFLQLCNEGRPALMV